MGQNSLRRILKKRRALNLETIEIALETEPLGHELARNALRDRMRELKATAPIPKLASSALGFKEVLQMFGLRQGQTILWESLNILRVPQLLDDDIARIRAVTQSDIRDFNEACSRTILDQILICSVYEEGNTKPSHAHPISTNANKEDAAMLELQHDTELSYQVIHQGEKKLLNGFADCTICVAKDTPTTNLVIIEAQRQKRDGFCSGTVGLRTWGIVHARRKKESQAELLLPTVETG